MSQPVKRIVVQQMSQDFLSNNKSVSVVLTCGTWGDSRDSQHHHRCNPWLCLRRRVGGKGDGEDKEWVLGWVKGPKGQVLKSPMWFCLN